jgi:hypothetical protein
MAEKKQCKESKYRNIAWEITLCYCSETSRESPEPIFLREKKSSAISLEKTSCGKNRGRFQSAKWNSQNNGTIGIPTAFCRSGFGSTIVPLSRAKSGKTRVSGAATHSIQPAKIAARNAN